MVKNFTKYFCLVFLPLITFGLTSGLGIVLKLIQDGFITEVSTLLVATMLFVMVSLYVFYQIENKKAFGVILVMLVNIIAIFMLSESAALLLNLSLMWVVAIMIAIATWEMVSLLFYITTS